jgi:glucose-1-phosphate cytidylyltransferase
MKVVIFAGGLGTRISEETDLRPKPMVEIGNKPILWHIMKIYEHYGFNDFIICLGYKGYVIKEYFMHYYLHNSDLTIELGNNNVNIHFSNAESFKVTLIDTGIETKTAGRLKKIQKYLGNENFLLTYGDGVADIDLNQLVNFHKSHGKIATVSTIQPGARFGGIDLDNHGNVISFKEKPKEDSKWINAGFFVLNPEVFSFLKDNSDDIMWEDEPMESLVKANQLCAYKHLGFWKCMDALRDKLELEEMWRNNKAKWKVW